MTDEKLIISLMIIIMVMGFGTFLASVVDRDHRPDCVGKTEGGAK